MKIYKPFGPTIGKTKLTLSAVTRLNKFSEQVSNNKRLSKRIRCKEIDNFKIDYDVTTTDNPWKLAYTHLKTNSKLSSVSDAQE